MQIREKEREYINVVYFSCNYSDYNISNRQ